jgi:hypothetical protein
MRPWPALIAAALLAGAGAACSQTVTLEPEAAQRCLTGPGEPEYPFEAWKTGVRGTVEVQLRFDAPDQPPVATLKATEGGDAAEGFVEAVRTHVARLRVPCMAPGAAPVRLEQVYVFRPDDRKVFWSGPRSADEAAQLEMLRCLVRPPESPPYPERALRQGVQGTVIAVARYEAPDRPPAITLHTRPDARGLHAAVRPFLEATRLPCHRGGPLEVVMSFVFRLEGEARGLRPMTLDQLLPVVRDLRRTGLTLDTRTMACPFDVEFQFRQPHLHNVAAEVGNTDPARRPLLEFLEGLDIAVPGRVLDAIYGDTTTITVPCLQIDIPPQEKSS